jgi:hypothetical protein
MTAPETLSNIRDIKMLSSHEIPFNISKINNELKITSPNFTSAIEIPLENCTNDMEFDENFTILREFCLKKTISNMKVKVLRKRRSGKISHPQARFAWDAVIARISVMQFKTKQDYLQNGAGAIDDIIDGYSIDSLPPFTQRAVKELFTGSCTGFSYPEKILDFKKNHWKSLKKEILALAS